MTTEHDRTSRRPFGHGQSPRRVLHGDAREADARQATDRLTDILVDQDRYYSPAGRAGSSQFLFPMSTP